MKVSKTLFPLSLLSVAFSAAAEPESDIERVTVYGDFYQQTLSQLSASASVIDDTRVLSRQADHLDGLLRVAPNVNFSAGASRGRFVQIRGIGERSQFAEPINPSVALMVDDFDFSGLGASGILFDTQQVEVFRGPQATVFGTGALAGAVLIKSNDADATDNNFVSARVATKDSYRVELANSVAVSDDLAVRAAVYHNRSDGFVKNAHLNREDTNNIDESAVKLAAKWQIDTATTLNLAYRWYDIDNGYDAFSLDNDNITQSDEPGFDRQQTHAVSANMATKLQAGELLLIVTHASHNIGYGYDEDWTYTGFHPWGYTSTDHYYREVDTNTAEIRFVGSEAVSLFNDTTRWVVGARLEGTEEDLLREYTYADGDFASQYKPVTIAFYGQLDSQLADNLSLSFGLRAENYNFSYADNEGLAREHDETMLGGKLALNYLMGDQLWYASISRGFKGAGINPDQNVQEVNRFFDAEYNWNYEIGVKAPLADSVNLRAAVFVMKREDTQVSDFDLQYREDNSAEFFSIITNADLGTNQGAEVELSWQANDRWSLNASVGYLDAYFENYTRVDDSFIAKQTLAQSPSVTANAFSQYSFTDSLTWNLEVDYTASYRFSDGHDVKSPAATLVHTQLVWQQNDLETTLWVNNLFDETYYTRGFGGFSNDPRDYYEFEEPYYQFGNGRQVGVTVRYQF
ncbi:Outer membrane receptor proteins, mostly Fe transport [Marisediminitalea aggregata]|uniref:Outer membrane receptor proteins, mostly Fe transport n=1 Tax=Marisediminitalea aggregata TaxID=634436 RepID=A0A1M5GH24_9ALTE|nr:TonB-dependent receptor [Marisediminitalea aggregata]SHG02996.1 Outer membrane receptor proteins, mostly Fe transport [Marisediminitalea aggregata]